MLKLSSSAALLSNGGGGVLTGSTYLELSLYHIQREGVSRLR